MTELPAALTITLEDTLALLDGKFVSFADGVAEGRYAFWLGSGISFDRFPGLSVLVTNVLGYLQSRCDLADPACTFHQALVEALALAQLTVDERAATDLLTPVDTWPTLGVLQDRLSQKYSSFLDIEIVGAANDALVWDGVNVVGVYADDTVGPGAEHLCLAVLIKEGMVEELASANWDGLIEKAEAMLNGGESELDVSVRSEDLQSGIQRATLTKFHGCAVRASEDEATYRPYIIGRQSQLDAWFKDSKMQGLIEHLKSVAIERPTLMLGLSAQDFNIRGLFTAAAAALSWSWPGDRPAYVFSEQMISSGQRSLLQCVYGDQYEGDARTEIQTGAHIQAFAKPLLLALVLYGYAAKVRRLKDLGGAPLDEGLRDWVDAGIVLVRDKIAVSNTGDHTEFTGALIKQVTRAISLFSVGALSEDAYRYEPISRQPVSQMAPGADVATSGLPEASVALSLLGQGAAAGDWELRNADVDDDKAGAVVLETATGQTQVFLLKDAYAEQELFGTGRIESKDDAILIHARELYDRMPRSPRKPPGRTGAIGPRRASIKALLPGKTDPEALMEQFKLELGL